MRTRKLSIRLYWLAYTALLLMSTTLAAMGQAGGAAVLVLLNITLIGYRAWREMPR